MSMRLFSPEWLDIHSKEASKWPVVNGVSATTQWFVEDSPTGTVAYFQVVRDGRLIENSFGIAPKPDVTLTYKFSTFVEHLKARQSGAYSPVVMFKGLSTGGVRVEGSSHIISMLMLHLGERNDAAIDVQARLTDLDHS